MNIKYNQTDDKTQKHSTDAADNAKNGKLPLFALHELFFSSSLSHE